MINAAGQAILKSLHDTTVELLDLLHTVQQAIKPNPLVPGLREALLMSANAVRQPTKVEVSPYLKNAMAVHGDPSDPIKVGEPLKKGEVAVLDRTRRGLEMFLGPDRPYPGRDADLAEFSYYITDCYRNLPENPRHQVPGMADQRKVKLQIYHHPNRGKWDPSTLLDFEGPVAAAALYTYEMLPEVVASPTVTDAALPFEKKFTGVGVPFNRNARTPITEDVIEVVKKWFPWFNDPVGTPAGVAAKHVVEHLVETG